MSVINYLKSADALTVMPHSVVFALRKEKHITALPLTIPHPERALAILRRVESARSPAIDQFAGGTVYWIGPAGPEQDAGPGTDFHAVRTGNISVSPIHVDLTRFQALEKVSSWMQALSDDMATGQTTHDEAA